MQGVLEEMRDGNVMRSVRFDSELPNVVCEIPFFVGISQPRTFQARKTSDVTLLALSKFDYEEVMCIYPEQNDIIVSNVLAYFQLDKDGNDASLARQTDPEPGSLAEDSKEKIRYNMHLGHLTGFFANLALQYQWQDKRWHHEFGFGTQQLD